MRKVLVVAILVVASVALPGGTGLAAEELPAPAERQPTVSAPPRALPAEGGRRVVEFGARLDARRPNGRATCRTATFPTNGWRSCTWESLIFGTQETFLPPLGRGRITQVRVRVGNQTGPMRVEVLRALRRVDNNNNTTAYACCQLMRRSRVFTPARNRITAIGTNLSVFQSRRPDAAGYYVDEHLALSVLRPNVPIPAHIDPNAGMTGWYPGWQRVGENRAGPLGTSGAMILLRARWRAN